MDKKKRLITMVVTLLVLTIGVTFAYFIAKTGEGKQAGTAVTADTVDDLKFNVSKENLSLNINQFNFASGAGNLTDNVTATASLKANSTKKTAKYNYYVYFQIESNDYVYTTTDKKPEIVLSITGPNGEITSVDGLTYVSATNADGTVVKGFDITESKPSVVKIADSYEISSSSSTNYTNQEWTFTVTFINLDTNQVGNKNKYLTGKVLIQQEKIILNLSDVAKSGDSLADSIKLLSQKSISSISNLYYHDSNLENGANDNSYRYAGASESVNNYVCFGSDEVACPVDNLYRIIGVFDGRVKLIKADYPTSSLLGTDGDYKVAYSYDTSNYKGSLSALDIGEYYWNYKATGASGTWSTSLLNKTNLNINFLNNIGSKWSKMIDITTWKVGGNTVENIRDVIPSVAYQNEIVNPATSSTYDAKVGLMYASDYGFAAAPSAWTTKFNFYSSSSIKSQNWMYMGLNEWIISPLSSSISAFIVTTYGYLLKYLVNNSYSTRPVFYLSSSVKFSLGDGTSTSPYRIS